MKRIFTTIAAVLLTLTIWAQSPQKMSYQAVIRNDNGILVTSHSVGMRISILKDATPVYVETQTPTSNSNGLITIEIGGGTPVTGIFAGIDWSNGTYFIKTETDPAGGSNYTISGESQILSVPYALYANAVYLTKNSRPSEIYIQDDGYLVAIPTISVEKPYSLLPTVIDVDGNSYGTVKIGTQVWLAENLKTTKLNDNTAIPNIADNGAWNALNTPAYCWNNNDIANKAVYGALYNWFTVSTGKICPTGWHVPTDAEWNTLKAYLGSMSGGRIRETGTTNWNPPNTDAPNDSKFTALPAGGRDIDYYGIGTNCSWWASNGYNSTDAWFAQVSLVMTNLNVTITEKRFGLSVRCIKD